MPRLPYRLLAVTILLVVALGWPRSTEPVRRTTPVSPVLGIERDRAVRAESRSSRRRFRTIDGRGNNRHDPLMGAAGTPLLRREPPDYADGVSAMAGPERPSARTVSNIVCAQAVSRPNGAGASDFLWQWGQFLDHDISLTDGTDPPEPAPIAVPEGDPVFGPAGASTIAFNRSLYDHDSGTAPGNPRQQMNEITAWIDGSNVYGSSAARAAALRTFTGGRLRTSAGDLLPFNTNGLPNAGGSSPTLFLAGDVRANEQVGLTALHTLFVREHNRQAEYLERRRPRWSDERIYQKARRLVIAEVQVITYREFLPTLLGPGRLARYRGYDRHVDARIRNVFSTAAYRFGHSALSAQLLRLDAAGHAIPEGHLPLRDAFFSPRRIIDEGGIEPLLRGLAAQACQAIDAEVVDDVRNFLFGPPGAGGFDLAALNIQRGRDHGLPGYNAVRAAYGLPPATSFAEVNPDPAVYERLAEAYAHPDDIDAWVGGLAEPRLAGAMVGPLVAAVLVEQFEALRDGDRWWYARKFSRRQRRRIERTRLSHIIRFNTKIGEELPDDVFRVH